MFFTRCDEVSVVDAPHWEPYLFDSFGASYSKRVVKFENKYWFLKHSPRHEMPARRERLAFLLGSHMANVAEVRGLSPSQLERLMRTGIDLPLSATIENTYLVRMGFDYRWWQLPIKSLDRAVVAELVFSLWIRRRDAHAFNRVFVNGVPVFFDHLTGLLGEPQLSKLDRYFATGPDAGYAAWWRIEEIEHLEFPDILQMRRHENCSFVSGHNSGRVVYPVRKKDDLPNLFAHTVQRIQSIPTSFINERAIAAGFSAIEADELTLFLTRSAQELSEGVDILCGICGVFAD